MLQNKSRMNNSFFLEPTSQGKGKIKTPRLTAQKYYLLQEYIVTGDGKLLFFYGGEKKNFKVNNRYNSTHFVHNI